MTSGKIALLIFVIIFAGVFVVLLWMDLYMVNVYDRKTAEIKALQQDLRHHALEYERMKKVVGDPAAPAVQSSKNIWRYKATNRKLDFTPGAVDPGPDQFEGEPDWVMPLTPELTSVSDPMLEGKLLAAEELDGTRRKGEAKDMLEKYKRAMATAQERLQTLEAARAQVVGPWAQLPATNQQATNDLRTLVKDWNARQIKHRQDEADKRRSIRQKQVALREKKIDFRRQEAVWSREQNDMEKQIEQVTENTIVKAQREALSTELRPDGQVLSATVEGFKMVVIDIGRRNGVREGLKFTVYSDYFGRQRTKGHIHVAEVRETTSICKIIKIPRQMFISERTLYKTSDEHFRYDPFYTEKGADGSGMQPVPLKPFSPLSAKQDVIDQIIPPTTKQERKRDPQAEGVFRPLYSTPNTDPILTGDLISNPDWQPIISKREAHERFFIELARLRGISLERLHFSIMPDFSAEERVFLERAVRNNGCALHEKVMAATNLLVVREPFSDELSSNIQRLRFLADSNRKAMAGAPDGSPVANAGKAREVYLNAALLYNTRVMSAREVNLFFRERRRKADLLSGNMELAGRSTYVVRGVSPTRSLEQLRKYIEENNGIVVDALTDSVDYIVAGVGSEKDIENAKQLGVKIILERELDKHFAREK